jgi:hypothetical protein
MKLSHALAAISISVLLAGGVVVPAASAAPAPLTLIGPTQGEKLDTPYPTFSWAVPANVSESQVIVSRDKTTGADGLLKTAGKNYMLSESFYAGESSYRDKGYSFSPDDYYWQVNAVDVDGNTFVSAVQKFSVPLLRELKKAKTKIAKMQYNGQRAIFGNATAYCNYGSEQYYTQFVMEVWKGKKKLATSRQARGDCLFYFGVKSEAVWAPPASLKSGTKLTIKLYVAQTHKSTKKWGGIVLPKSKGPVTTLKITWKK